MTSWRHHYLPQFYLKQWCIPGKNKILSYYKNFESQIIEEELSTRSTGFIKDQNTIFKTPFINNNENSDALEKKYSLEIDNKSATVHNKLLISGKSSLSDDEIIIWATFIHSIIYRSPKYFNDNINKARETRKDILDIYKNNAKNDSHKENVYNKVEKLFTEMDAINDYKEINFDYIKSSDFIDSLKTAFWINTKIDMGFQLITSDYPLLINFSENNNPIYLINFPLSPNILQTIYFINDIDVNKHLANIIDLLLVTNLKMILQSPNYIYSSFQLNDDGLIKYKKAMELSLKPRKPEDVN